MGKFYTSVYDRKHPEENLLAKATRDLPGVVERSAFYLGNKSGGLADFACPCCNKKVTVYHNNQLNRIAVNTWGHCSHFGDNGEYPNDAIGFKMAEAGLANTYENAMEILKDYNIGAYSKGDYYSAENTRKREEKRREVMEENTYIIKRKTSWGDDMPQVALDLLKTRGIDVSKLRPSTRGKIGYCEDIRLLKLKDGGTYKATGIIFELVNDGYQIRRSNKKGFLKKEDGVRFYTMGPATPFNVDVLDYANGLDPTFVVEGPMDAISMECALYREDTKVPKAQVISIQGCANHRYFAEELKRRGGKMVLFLALDSDEAGADSQLKLKDALKDNASLTILPFPGYMGFKDMNEMLMADKTKASWYMQMIHAIGRHVADGRVSLEDGKELLMEMAQFTPSKFEWCKTRTRERFVEAVKKQEERKIQAPLEEAKQARQKISTYIDSVSSSGATNGAGGLCDR